MKKILVFSVFLCGCASHKVATMEKPKADLSPYYSETYRQEMGQQQKLNSRSGEKEIKITGNPNEKTFLGDILHSAIDALSTLK